MVLASVSGAICGFVGFRGVTLEGSFFGGALIVEAGAVLRPVRGGFPFVAGWWCAMSKWGEDRVLVEVYIRGKGPVHKLKLPWEGYEKNQVDLESVVRKCRLKAIYAYSLQQGRGKEQFFNPRNGLSPNQYSGMPDSIIRFDGEPKPTIASIASRYVLALVLVGFLLIGASTSKKEWVVEAQQLLGGRVTWIACFVIMMFSHLAQRSFRTR